MIKEFELVDGVHVIVGETAVLLTVDVGDGENVMAWTIKDAKDKFGEILTEIGE